MTEELWNNVDRYFNELLIPHDPALEGALEGARAGNLPDIGVAPNQGRLLQILALACGARKILEIGTLGAYSTLWMARALPDDGVIITLEADPRHAEVARANIARAGLAERITVREGQALDTLSQLAAEGATPFDMVFIDADKVNTPAYFEWALKLTRKGSFIVVDNVVRRGAVLDTESDDPNVQGMRRFHALLAGEPRITATVLQTVGSKGYDGVAIALVREGL